MKLVIGLIMVMLIFGCTSTTEDAMDETGDSMQETGDSMEEHMDEMMEDGMGQMHGVTLSQFAQHDNEGDCWLLYKGQVYDITVWLPNHPSGADSIIMHCGKNTFEEAFTNKHGEDKVEILQTEGVLIGNLIE